MNTMNMINNTMNNTMNDTINNTINNELEEPEASKATRSASSPRV